MINLKDFNSKPDYYVSSFSSLLTLCKKLREKETTKEFYIALNLSKDERGRSYVFPYSYFKIEVIGDNFISNDLYATKLDDKGKELITFRTPTLKIYGHDNIFLNLNVENSKGNSSLFGQEVALGVYNGDNIFINCHFRSEQDTLFLAPFSKDLMKRYKGFLPDIELDDSYKDKVNYFINCIVEGTVDFIFGAGNAIFYHSKFVSLYDSREGYVFAPSHEKENNLGFFVYRCEFLARDISKQISTCYFARPWRDYGLVVIKDCKFDKHIKKEGFSNWSDVDRSKTCRFFESPYIKDRKLSLEYQTQERYSKLIELVSTLESNL